MSENSAFEKALELIITLGLAQRRAEGREKILIDALESVSEVLGNLDEPSAEAAAAFLRVDLALASVKAMKAEAENAEA